jgi:hypothetical protein
MRARYLLVFTGGRLLILLPNDADAEIVVCRACAF